MVFAFAGDSTTTSVLERTRVAIGFFSFAGFFSSVSAIFFFAADFLVAIGPLGRR